MSGVRVTYSGLVALGIRFSSVFTGLIFLLVVTRQLSENEFGTWGIINGLMIYAVIVNPIINYWLTREIARGEKSAKTAVSTSLVFSIAGTGFYFIMALLVSTTSEVDIELLLFAMILIPAVFLNDSLSALNAGFRPQAASYGFFVFEITKVPMGFILVYFLDWGLEGAIIATFISYLSGIIILGYFAKEKLKTTFDITYLKKWIKLSWLPVYRNLPSLLSLSDVVVFTVVTGSVVGVAYYSAARSIGYLVNHTRSFSTGLYPKLLEGGNKDHLQENLIRLFYFAFPLVGLSLSLARPALFALNPLYEIAFPVVMILSVRSFFTTINVVFFQALQGIEKVDTQKNPKFKDFIKSKLILYPTFQLGRNVIYFSGLFVMLWALNDIASEIDLVIYWALLGLIIEIPLFLYIFRLTKKSFEMNVDKKSMIKYLFVSIMVFTPVYFIAEEYLVYQESIFEFFPQLMIILIASAGSYVLITYFIDHRTKALIKSVIREVQKK